MTNRPLTRVRPAVVGLIALAFLALPAGASAGIGAFGPVDLAHGNYPSTYTDEDGLALELCLDGPFCLATAERPDPNEPVDPFVNFPGESFWWAGEAAIGEGDVSALLVLAQEAAFIGEDPVDGEQIAFGRVRVRVFSGLVPGAFYRVTHPYGVLEAQAAAGTPQINDSDDVGCLVPPCDPDGWDDLAASQVGPTWLQWDSLADRPDGFIGDPAVDHTVIGSPNNTNFFRIQQITGFDGAVVDLVAETDLFSIQGMIAGDPAPFFFRNPRSVDFGAQLVGTTSAARTVTIGNGGLADMTLSSIAVGGANAGEFAQTNDCPAVLVPAASCTASITFTPGAAGARSAALVVTDSATGSPHSIPLAGTGTVAVGPGAAGPAPGAGAPAAPLASLLRVTDLRARSLGLRRARRIGIRTSFVVPSGMQFVQVSLFRLRNAALHRTRKLVARRTFAVTRPGRHAVRFRDRRVRRLLRRGRYVIQVRGGASADSLGPPAARRIRIR